MEAILGGKNRTAWIGGIALVAILIMGGSVALARRGGGIALPGSAPESEGPQGPAFKVVPPPAGAAGYPADASPLRITEVYLGESRDESQKAEVWAELHCARGPVDLIQYSLSDLDGKDLILVSRSLVLRTGEYAVVRWSEGATEFSGDANGNGVRDVYLASVQGNPTNAAPSRNIDQLVLIRRTEDTLKRLDAVAWTQPGLAPERWEADDLTELQGEGLWEGPSMEVRSFAALTPGGGASWVLRDLSAPHKAASWALTAVATPGAPTEVAMIPSVGSLILTEVSPGATRRESFAEIRASTTVNLRAFAVTDLDGEASPLAENDLTLQAGEYAVVHWADGLTEIDARGDQDHSGFRDIYLSSDQAPSRTMDVLLLALGGQVYDAVAWRETGKPATEEFDREIRELKARGINLAAHELTGPEMLLARSDATPWRVTALATPGSATRLVAPPARGMVQLSEVFPAGAGSWAEVEVSRNAPAEGIDVSLFLLTDLDGPGEILARDPLTLKPGERLVVRWGAGQDEVDGREDANGNGIREVFLDRSEPPTATTDQLAMYFGTVLHSALAWTNKEEKVTASEREDFVNLGLQPVIRPELASLARVGARIEPSFDPTPYQSNDHYRSRSFAGVRLVAFQVSREASWVEVEATGGPTDISRLKVSDLDGEAEERPLSEEPILLRAGERARIQWGKGTNDLASATKTIWIDQDPPTKGGDEIALLHNGRILDAVVFTDMPGARFAYPEQDDVKRLVELGAWRTRSISEPDAVEADAEIIRRTQRGWDKSEG